MSNELEGRTALVTGAGSGIGRAIAKHLGKLGASLILVDRVPETVEALASELRWDGVSAVGETFDVRDSKAFADACERAVNRTGTLNMLVNCAGVDFGGRVLEGKADQWREMFETNVVAVLVGAQAAVSTMRRHGFQGHIVNIGSNGGRREYSGVYGATKAAINVIGSTMRRELEGDDIRVVQILPGAILTNFTRHQPAVFIKELLRLSGEDPDQFVAGTELPKDVLSRVQKAARRLFSTPEDVADAVIYAVTRPIEVNINEILLRPPADIVDINLAVGARDWRYLVNPNI